MNSLPIENDKELLMEYGRAFAWFSLVEVYLEILIWNKGKLANSERGMIEKLLKNKTLGNKIFLVKDFLDDQLKKDLKELNQNRNTLAHSSIVTAEVDNGNEKELKHFL